MRPVEEDLSPAQRAGYGMRVHMNVNGINYFAYYLKAVDLQNSFPSVTELTVNGDETVTEVEYIPTSSQLAPVPVILANAEANLSTGKHLSVMTTLQLELTADDLREILDACLILSDDPATAVISEMAVVSGYLKSIDSTAGGINVTYDEVVRAQCANFIPTNLSVQFNSDGIRHTYSMGDTMPYTR
jgi:hypothetical protein